MSDEEKQTKGDQAGSGTEASVSAATTADAEASAVAKPAAESRAWLRRHLVSIALLLLAAGLAWHFAPELKQWLAPLLGEEDEAHDEHAHDTGVVYTCPMHPSVRQNTPGICPLCAMALVPVEETKHDDGSVVLDAAHRERAGIKTAAASMQPMHRELRAVGDVRYDETRLTDVSLRVGGWVEKLHVDETGARVRKGQPLLELWSPELLAAEQDYLAARARGASLPMALPAPEGVPAPQGGALEASGALVRAAKQRLLLLGMTEAQVEALEQRSVATGKLQVGAPASGHVIEKTIVAGARFEPGMRLYRIGALDRVWVEARIQERDLPFIQVGQAAQVRVPGSSAGDVEAKVSLIYPEIDDASRTARVRLEIPNAELQLRPGVYVDVELHADLGERLTVPDSAVLYTGPRKLVFVDVGEGKLEPREVQLGVHAHERYEIVSGLSAGEQVVVAGNFLVAAESRIRSGSTLLGGAPSSGAQGGGHAH